jgi:hypothetical protein
VRPSVSQPIVEDVVVAARRDHPALAVGRVPLSSLLTWRWALPIELISSLQSAMPGPTVQINAKSIPLLSMAGVGRVADRVTHCPTCSLLSAASAVGSTGRLGSSKSTAKAGDTGSVPSRKLRSHLNAPDRPFTNVG